MELDNSINQRFSVKSFTDKKVGLDAVTQLLGAGGKAPSAGNLQDWRFIVVTDEGKKDEIASACMEQVWIGQAPVLIVVCSDLTNLRRFYEDRAEIYGIEDCSAATENILLKATDMGLNSTWVSAFDEGEVMRVLRTPDSYKVISVIAIGYSEEKLDEKQRHDIKTLTYYNEYGSSTSQSNAFPLVKEENVKAVKEAAKESKGFFEKLKEKFSNVRDELKKEDE